MEGNETFRVELLTLFLPVPINISAAEVTIVDDDCKTFSVFLQYVTIVIHSVATVEFEEKFNQVNESDGFVEICAVVKLPVVGCPIAALSSFVVRRISPQMMKVQVN